MSRSTRRNTDGPGFGQRLRELRHARSMRQADLAARLGIGQTTVANYETGTRFPDERTLVRIADLLAVSLDHLLGRSQLSPGTAPPSSGLPELQADYLAALLADDQEGAAARVIEAAGSGVPLRGLYLQVLQPALRKIGDLWQAGRIDVAQEHFATATTELVLSRLHPWAAAVPCTGPTLVALPAYGEMHTLGLRMVSEFLRLEGWRTFYLGALVPARSLTHSLGRYRADLLALSVTMPCHLESAEGLIAGVRGAAPGTRVRVLAGGRAFLGNPTAWRDIGADGYAADAAEAVEAAKELVRGVD